MEWSASPALEAVPDPVLVKEDTSSARDCAVFFEPCKYPCLERVMIFSRAFEHTDLALTDEISERENAVSKEEVRVLSSSDDLSCTAAAFTRASHIVPLQGMIKEL